MERCLYSVNSFEVACITGCVSSAFTFPWRDLHPCPGKDGPSPRGEQESGSAPGPSAHVLRARALAAKRALHEPQARVLRRRAVRPRAHLLRRGSLAASRLYFG